MSDENNRVHNSSLRNDFMPSLRGSIAPQAAGEGRDGNEKPTFHLGKLSRVVPNAEEQGDYDDYEEDDEDEQRFDHDDTEEDGTSDDAPIDPFSKDDPISKRAP
jgi:hypothetical protein